MTNQIAWLSARFVDIDGSAKPGSYDDGHGNRNAVAAVRIASQHNGDAIILEGRPEDLLARGREIMRTIEGVVEQTMRDPELRRLYGFPERPNVGAEEQG
jgi:hypothetical protein